MSSHIIRLHLEDYRNAEVVEKARRIAKAFPGVSDQWSARGQWEFFAAVEPEFKENYAGLLEELAKQGIKARLLDPVRLVFSAHGTLGDARKVDSALRKQDPKHFRAPLLDSEKGQLVLYVARERLEPATFDGTLRQVERALRALAATTKPKLTSHEWVRLELKEVDCRDCAYDLEIALGRLDGVVLSKVDLERNPWPRGRLKALVVVGSGAHRRISETVARNGFKFKLEGGASPPGK